MTQKNEAYENFIKNKLFKLINEHKEGKMKMSETLKQFNHFLSDDQKDKTYHLKGQLLGDDDGSGKRLRIEGVKFKELGLP